MESQEERLLTAARNGDLQTMTSLIETGAQVNARGYSGMTALMTGMFLYAGDGLIFLLVKDWLGLGFHLFVLWQLYRGLSALNESGEAKLAGI